MKSYALVICLAALLVGFAVPLHAEVPSVTQIFPSASSAANAVADEDLNFYLDGTLSMRGFAHSSSREFPQLLQDLDLTATALWKPNHIHYYRFGGTVVDAITQHPFYVAASTDSFYKGTKDYQKTQIENVFRRAVPGRLTVVMTDLFEQDLDISAIQQSLEAAAFPANSSLAVWQWTLPFDGQIYDFDFRVTGGRPYKGNRFIYLLALGSRTSIESLDSSLKRNMTVTGWKYLLLSGHLAAALSDWAHVLRTTNAALKSRTESAPVYRIARGCDSSELMASVVLPAVPGTPLLPAFPGAYQVSLFGLSNGKDGWHAHELTGPSTWSSREPSGRTMLHVKVNCPSVVSAHQTLLRIRRIGTDEDVKLPEWVEKSSATNAEFASPENLKSPEWGRRTLNLTPFIRELAAKAIAGTTLATAYVYLVSD